MPGYSDGSVPLFDAIFEWAVETIESLPSKAMALMETAGKGLSAVKHAAVDLGSHLPEFGSPSKSPSIMAGNSPSQSIGLSRSQTMDQPGADSYTPDQNRKIEDVRLAVTTPITCDHSFDCGHLGELGVGTNGVNYGKFQQQQEQLMLG